MDYLIVGIVVFCCIAVPFIVRAVMRRKGRGSCATDTGNMELRAGPDRQGRRVGCGCGKPQA
jgi:hypothetical protein